MRETPVFLGLTRPPKFFGLPIGYFIGLMLLAVIPFIALNEWKFLLIIPVAYPVLWLIADRNPHLFEIMATVYSRMPPTKNRELRDGDSYTTLTEAPSEALRELLGKAAAKEEPSGRHLPYLRAETDNIIITRQGDLMASAVLGGIDSITTEDVEIDALAEGFARQVGQLGEEFGFYINKVTVPERIDLKLVEADGFSTEVDRRWRQQLERRDLQDRVPSPA